MITDSNLSGDTHGKNINGIDSEILFSTIFHRSPIGMSLVNITNGKQIDINNACVKIFGYTREEVINNTALQFNIYQNPADREELLANLKKYGSVFSKEIALFRKNREIAYLEVSAELIHIKNEQIALLMMTDITEKKKAQNRLIESELNFRQIAGAIDDIFWMSDIFENKVYYVSPAYEKIWGHSPESLYNNPESQLETIIPEDRGKFLDSINHQSSGNAYEVEYRIQTPDGQVKHILDRGFPVKNEEGKIVRFAGIAKDITKEKLHEEKILKVNEELEQKVKLRTRELTELNLKLNDLNDTKDKFFSIIAHDLKNPFNSIQIFSKLMMKYHEQMDSEKLQKSISHISKSAENAYNLLENLLEWAGTQTGSMKFYPERISVGEYIQYAVEGAGSLAGSKKITLSVDFDQNLYLNADKNMIHAILRNLITNAIKFTPTGGEILLRAFKNEVGIEFEISDNGIGMSPEIQQHLFSLKEKTQMPGTDNEPGTGLGLILTKEFVDMHKGSIRIESEEGKGTNIFITIPQ